MSVSRPIQLALSMYSNRGAFALLLGSGLSSAAGIKTGWEIRQELLHQVASGAGVNDVSTNLDEWYEANFQKPASYSNILESIDPSQGGRSGFLRRYVTPTEDESSRGIKVPTEAHHRLASLAARGYVRVILTTNFDRLMEQALEARGVSFQVIASPDAADGARPFMLEACTLIKLNGDIQDARIKNTEVELENYDERLESLLERVLSDLGLIVSGWSAESDPALQRILGRIQSRLFATFWTYRSAPKPQSSELIQARRASQIKIVDADSFFASLDDQIASLERALNSQSLDVRALTDTVSKYVADDRYRNDLEDLVIRESRRLIDGLPDHDTPQDPRHRTDEQIQRLLNTIEVLTEPMRAIFIAGCNRGSAQHRNVWIRALNQMGSLPGEEQGRFTRPDLRLYAAVLCFYAGGIAAVAANRFDNLAALLTGTRFPYFNDPQLDVGAVIALIPDHVMDDARWSRAVVPNVAANFGPARHHLHDLLQPSFSRLYVRESEYSAWFDRFEYLSMLAFAEAYERLEGRIWAPRGKLMLAGHRRERDRKRLVQGLVDEANLNGNQWGPITAGLFRSVDRFSELVNTAANWSSNW